MKSFANALVVCKFLAQCWAHRLKDMFFSDTGEDFWAMGRFSDVVLVVLSVTNSIGPDAGI